jgi:hypothetical protein
MALADTSGHAPSVFFLLHPALTTAMGSASPVAKKAQYKFI